MNGGFHPVLLRLVGCASGGIAGGGRGGCEGSGCGMRSKIHPTIGTSRSYSGDTADNDSGVFSSSSLWCVDSMVLVRFLVWMWCASVLAVLPVVLVMITMDSTSFGN